VARWPRRIDNCHGAYHRYRAGSDQSAREISGALHLRGGLSVSVLVYARN